MENSRVEGENSDNPVVVSVSPCEIFSAEFVLSRGEVQGKNKGKIISRLRAVTN